MYLELLVIVAPEMISRDWRVMTNLLKPDVVSANFSLIGLSQNRIKGLHHLHCKLSDAHRMSHHKLESLQLSFKCILGYHRSSLKEDRDCLEEECTLLKERFRVEDLDGQTNLSQRFTF